VPSVVDSVSMQDRERLTKALHRYSEYSGDLQEFGRFVPEAKPGKPAVPATNASPGTP
jgi:hypothetical protein